ncbi:MULTISPECIES: glycogen synthase [unclassified Fibrobacter]|uniref:glycogen synthase n=1 Tax=unclassified Fibrobacter TaxID=2634177 RepID=UPI000D6A81E3|nr:MULTISPECIES: glycogen/starch synthase [unclassified Fibrobacter]PWJ65584.1 starch synthase [Fibrobacter sp. UWR4]PZW72349.1 starch synthase [Fibrobacter sp. UWR1]
MNILVVSPEAGNWKHTSPLATAVNRMTDAFASGGVKVLTCSPFFKSLLVDVDSYHCIYTGEEKLLGKSYQIFVSDKDPLHTYIYNEEYFGRPDVYGPPDEIPYLDNHLRFAFLASAALAYAEATEYSCQAIMGHEWGGALVGALARTTYAGYAGEIPFFFNVHNITYDFHVPSSEIEKIGLPRENYNMDGYEFWGKVSLLKAGILYATKVLFPSPGYRDAMLNTNLPGGLSGFLNRNADKLIGVQFGVSYQVWDFNDQECLPIKEAKRRAKHSLQEKLGQNLEQKMVMYVHLDTEAGNTSETLATVLSDITRLDIFIIVGISSKDPDWEYYKNFSSQYPSVMAIHDLSDESVDGTIVLRDMLAGSDLLFAASLREPSSSIILKAMAAGTIPLTGRAVGVATMLTDYTLETAGEANAFLVEDANAPDQMLRRTKDVENVFKTEVADWDKCVVNAYSGFHYEWCRTISKYLLILGELGI